jgi:hypothetical protein
MTLVALVLITAGILVVQMGQRRQVRELSRGEVRP